MLGEELGLTAGDEGELGEGHKLTAFLVLTLLGFLFLMVNKCIKYI